MSKPLTMETSPPIIRLGLGSLGLCLGRRWDMARGLAVLWAGECVWGSLRGERPWDRFGEGALTLGLSLLFHFVRKGTKVV